MRPMPRSIGFCSRCLDFDLEFRASETSHNDQGRGETSSDHVAAANGAVDRKKGSIGHESIEPHDIAKIHARGCKNGPNILKAENRLSLDAVWDDVIRPNAQLTGSKQQAGRPKNFDRVAVGRKRRTNGGWVV